eukprot:1963230-Amphidinium_carterae.1
MHECDMCEYTHGCEVQNPAGSAATSNSIAGCGDLSSGGKVQIHAYKPTQRGERQGTHKRTKCFYQCKCSPNINYSPNNNYYGTINN